MRTFHFSENKIDPREIANKVLGLVDVDSVLKHKGNRNRKRQLIFLVHWKGFDDKHD
jgi:hypothetical protein